MADPFPAGSENGGKWEGKRRRRAGGSGRGRDQADFFAGLLVVCFEAPSLPELDELSDFVDAGVDSVLVSDVESDFESVFLSEVAVLASDPFSAGRLSVLYQPDPLKTIAGVDIRRRGFLPQLGHFSRGSSLYDCTAENTWPQ